MKWNVIFSLRDFRKKKRNRPANRDNRSKANRKNESKKQTRHQRKSKKQTKYQKKSKKTRHQKNSKKRRHQMIARSKISQKRKQNLFFVLDRKTKKHKHRNTETINNNRYSINKIISFDRWYRWDHRRIKQCKTTNSITN